MSSCDTGRLGARCFEWHAVNAGSVEYNPQCERDDSDRTGHALAPMRNYSNVSPLGQQVVVFRVSVFSGMKKCGATSGWSLDNTVGVREATAKAPLDHGVVVAQRGRCAGGGGGGGANVVVAVVVAMSPRAAGSTNDAMQKEESPVSEEAGIQITLSHHKTVSFVENAKGRGGGHQIPITTSIKLDF